MKFLADENIPYKAINELKKKGFSIQSIIDIRPGMADLEILKYGFDHELIIITFDKDFGELIFKEKQPSKGIILIRIIPNSYFDVVKLITDILKESQPFENKYVVIKENHIRIIDLKKE